jgi:hypothetical protein
MEPATCLERQRRPMEAHHRPMRFGSGANERKAGSKHPIGPRNGGNVGGKPYETTDTSLARAASDTCATTSDDDGFALKPGHDVLRSLRCSRRERRMKIGGGKGGRKRPPSALLRHDSRELGSRVGLVVRRPCWRRCCSVVTDARCRDAWRVPSGRIPTPSSRSRPEGRGW